MKKEIKHNWEDGLITSGIKCECGRFVDFTKEVKRLRKEAVKQAKQKWLEEIEEKIREINE